jgi:hypothetical protein
MLKSVGHLVFLNFLPFLLSGKTLDGTIIAERERERERDFLFKIIAHQCYLIDNSYGLNIVLNNIVAVLFFAVFGIVVIFLI